jgi:hypothetical protein
LRERLAELFKPETGYCYQKVQALPAVDEIDVTQDKTVLVIANPHPGGLNPDLATLYDNVDFKNRICFLTGQRSFDSLLNAAKELKAIRHIIDELKSEGAPDNDPQLVQARDLLDRIQNQFRSALRETTRTRRNGRGAVHLGVATIGRHCRTSCSGWVVVGASVTVQVFGALSFGEGSRDELVQAWHKSRPQGRESMLSA